MPLPSLARSIVGNRSAGKRGEGRLGPRHLRRQHGPGRHRDRGRRRHIAGDRQHRRRGVARAGPGDDGQRRARKPCSRGGGHALRGHRREFGKVLSELGRIVGIEQPLRKRDRLATEATDRFETTDHARYGACRDTPDFVGGRAVLQQIRDDDVEVTADCGHVLSGPHRDRHMEHADIFVDFWKGGDADRARVAAHQRVVEAARRQSAEHRCRHG